VTQRSRNPEGRRRTAIRRGSSAAANGGVDRWYDRLDALHFETDAFINNEFVAAVSGCRFEKISPLRGSMLTTVAACEDVDVDRAVNAAEAALRGPWSRVSAQARKALLLSFAAGIASAREELALLTTVEVGKPITASLAEVESTPACLSYYAEAIDKVYGEVAPTDPDARRNSLQSSRVLCGRRVDDRHEMSVPFGGFKESGIGVDKSLHALAKYTRLKSTWLDLTPPRENVLA
jgi:acyl-CoA reductase-like NAD-dependent aldehyde dehydrogenase